MTTPAEDITDAPKRLPLWPLVYCISPILLGLGLVLYVNWDVPPTNNAAPEIPSLGGDERPVKNAPSSYVPDNTEPETTPEDNSTPDGVDENPDSEPESAPPVETTERQIDIYIQRLSHAAKVRDGKGVAANRELLKQAHPPELVDERLRFALENSRNAYARLALFETFRDSKNALDWADYVFTTRYSKYTGEDETLAQGEQAELLAAISSTLATFVEAADYDANPKYRAYVVDLIRLRKPPWAWDVVALVVERVLFASDASLAKSFSPDIQPILIKGDLKTEEAYSLFVMWARQYETVKELIDAMTLPDFAPYYMHLLRASMLERLDAGTASINRRTVFSWWMKAPEPESDPEWFLYERLRTVLTGELMDASEIKLLIQSLGKFGKDSLLLEGIARRDEFLPDYLSALGYKQTDPAILTQLAKEADSPDVATAIGAIHGLRQWGNSEGDTTLRKVLEHGNNIGVKSHALGALLGRAQTTDTRNTLLEEYLDANKSASLRAVAVAHVPEDDLKRLQKIVDEDGSARVRTAALQRLGAASKTLTSGRAKKAMRAWFLKVKDRDGSPVIRSQARQFAEALLD
ncbi:hypothetical protein OAU50_02365 [Planctomycetota bacterium]|nr:hypothetical protein [Planctomycetota bacterium]